MKVNSCKDMVSQDPGQRDTLPSSSGWLVLLHVLKVWPGGVHADEWARQ
jgi:hypothetical protein